MALEAPDVIEVTLENPVARVKVSNRGGRVVSWVLPEYSEYGGKRDNPIELVPLVGKDQSEWPLDIRLADAEDTAGITSALFAVEESTERRIRLRYRSADGLEVVKVLELEGTGYLARLLVEVRRKGVPEPFWIAWGPGIANHTIQDIKNGYFLRSAAVGSQAGKLTEVMREKQSKDFQGKAFRWVAVQDNYFAAALQPPEAITGAAVRFTARRVLPSDAKQGDEGKEEEVASLDVPFRGSSGYVQLFVGPKRKAVLRALGQDYVALIRLGDWIGWIGHILLSGLLWLHEHVSSNYGVAIVLLTVLIRLLFFPFTHLSMKRMRAMQEKIKKVKPAEKKLREKYQKGGGGMDARRRMNEELMALYRKEGINPADQLSGCLPLLIQMPIFFAFFRLLPAAIELRQQPFVLWIRDLSAQDPYFISPLLMGVTMFASTKAGMSAAPGMETSQKMMLYAMPLVFTFFCLSAPSGLVLYWLVSNVIQIGQQALVQRSFRPEGKD